MDAIEKWGVSVEEAVDLALKEMKLSKEDVTVTVLEEPSRGFFGIGSKLAKVRVERKAPVVEDKQIEKKEAPVKKAGPIIRKKKRNPSISRWTEWIKKACRSQKNTKLSPS